MIVRVYRVWQVNSKRPGQASLQSRGALWVWAEYAAACLTLRSFFFVYGPPCSWAGLMCSYALVCLFWECLYGFLVLLASVAIVLIGWTIRVV